MTVRRKDTNETFKLSVDGWTQTYRTAIIVAILSMHPVGQTFLSNLGFNLPSSSAGIHKDVEEIKAQLAAVTQDVAGVKQDIRVVKTQVTGFEINFERYRKQTQP